MRRGKKLQGAMLNGGLLLSSLLVSLVFAEWLFLRYEQAQLAGRFSDDQGIVDLRALNYIDSTIPIAKPADEFRVLSFGDSFAYSIMTYEYSYSGVAATLVNAALGSPRVRIVNLGEPATSVNDYVAACQYWSAALQPEAVLFNIFLGNDLLDIAFQYVPPQWIPNRIHRDLRFHIADGRRRSHVPHKFPLRILDYAYAYYLQYRYASLAVAKEIWLGDFRIVLGEVTDPRYNLASTHNLPEDFYLEVSKGQLVNFDFSQIDRLLPGYLAIYNLMRFASELLTGGQQVLITLAPNESQVDGNLLAQLVDRSDPDRYDLTLPARVILAIRDQVDPRIPVLDLTGYFQCRAETGEKLYHNRNTHWNLDGNALAGTVIAATLQRSWFAMPATLPSGLEECAESKSRIQQRVSTESIERFISQQLLPRTTMNGSRAE
jgi:hypothetical protein